MENMQSRCLRLTGGKLRKSESDSVTIVVVYLTTFLKNMTKSADKKR